MKLVYPISEEDIALQIEINRSLYMNERTFEKTPGFNALMDDLTDFARELMLTARRHFTDLPLAAE